MNEIFKIARILNMETVVINAGKNQGLSKGDILEIFEEPDPVFDPDTGNQIGSLAQRKALIIIIDTAENLSVCENYEKKNISLPSSIVSIISNKTTAADLNVACNQIQPLPIDDQPISVGDKVRIVKKASQDKQK